MNPKVRNIRTQLLSDNWYTLNKIIFDYLNDKGVWETQERESYDRGNGAAILLYNKEKKTIILTRQFRMPTYLNGNKDGMSIEVCAGLLDGDEPEVCAIKEAEEESGYRVKNIERVLEAYMSPGAVTEIVYLFIAEYTDEMKVSEGGGLDDEHENIEVLEVNFNEALDMVKRKEIHDGKTIMLLQYAQIHNLVE
ncbi:GDP-mannose pyrophosphatase NudK [Urechidicola vernalis]|uniref:GDP-mannose pyrophosphatase n=1 Tax=Urechidicola vernalis TaxID=3075600 RepID=A0ABU2Y2F6_9FLAO|nr:GDP-mannose pyrophosphatase NudK [Urechidicola sp. P050]MDT0552381.1 GDP-mannose pyrophosphatase NudK [Urechidicola sp. P050]